MALQSRRNCKGDRWHGKGYRDGGDLYVQLKRAYCDGPFTRGHPVNENATMSHFISGMVRDIQMEEGFQCIPEGLFLEFQAFRGKELQPSDDAVTDYFDGGEIVHAKASFLHM